MGPDGHSGAPPGHVREGVDWGTGSYEDTTAAELLPVARTVVRAGRAPG